MEDKFVQRVFKRIDYVLLVHFALKMDKIRNVVFSMVGSARPQSLMVIISPVQILPFVKVSLMIRRSALSRWVLIAMHRHHATIRPSAILHVTNVIQFAPHVQRTGLLDASFVHRDMSW